MYAACWPASLSFGSDGLLRLAWAAPMPDGYANLNVAIKRRDAP